MKKMKLPLIAACSLVLASQVSFAGGGGKSQGASSNTDTQGAYGGTTSDTMSGDTTSGATSGAIERGTTSGTTTQKQYGQQKSGQAALIKKGETYQVLNFTGKTAKLTQMQKNEIKTLIDAAKKKGEIDQVHVAVWSDKAFPMQQGQELSDADKNLAVQRISALETYMNDDLKLENVETYSMAERTNFFARALNTDEAELQSLFSQEGAPQNVDAQEFKIVKKEGGPNKAVIHIEMKDQARKPASTTDHSSQSGSTSTGMDEGGMIDNEQQRAPSSVDDTFGTDTDMGDDSSYETESPESSDSSGSDTP